MNLETSALLTARVSCLRVRRCAMSWSVRAGVVTRTPQWVVTSRRRSVRLLWTRMPFGLRSCVTTTSKGVSQCFHSPQRVIAEPWARRRSGRRRGRPRRRAPAGWWRGGRRHRRRGAHGGGRRCCDPVLDCVRARDPAATSCSRVTFPCCLPASAATGRGTFSRHMYRPEAPTPPRSPPEPPRSSQSLDEPRPAPGPRTHTQPGYPRTHGPS